MNDNNACPIWGTPSNPDEFYRGDGLNVDSPRTGGKYFVDGRAATRVGDLDDREKALLTTWMIGQRRSGVERPKLYDFDMESIIQRPDLSIHARADELMKYIHAKTSHPGHVYKIREFGSNDKMELFAYTESVNNEDLLYLINHLVEKSWLEEKPRTLGSIPVILTVDGYDHLAELENEVTDKSRSQAFVAMWFDETLDAAWEDGIKPAIEDSGYKAVRIDEVGHLNKIDEQIITEIRRSRFIVADFTQDRGGARGGVYYEAGFAQGLDIPVIFTCRKDSIDKVHFNTRQYPHLLWKSPEELRERLTKHIAMVIGEVPLKSEQ